MSLRGCATCDPGVAAASETGRWNNELRRQARNTSPD
jgi:hypothetical protein